jgi:hypothetical protein
MAEKSIFPPRRPQAGGKHLERPILQSVERPILQSVFLFREPQHFEFSLWRDPLYNVFFYWDSPFYNLYFYLERPTIHFVFLFGDPYNLCFS